MNERGQYRLQSEDGGTLDMQSRDAAGAPSNGSTDPLSDLLSIGRAAVQNIQPDAAETAELAQLVTPLVLGGWLCPAPYLHSACCNESMWTMCV